MFGNRGEEPSSIHCISTCFPAAPTETDNLQAVHHRAVAAIERACARSTPARRRSSRRPVARSPRPAARRLEASGEAGPGRVGGRRTCGGGTSPVVYPNRARRRIANTAGDAGVRASGVGDRQIVPVRLPPEAHCEGGVGDGVVGPALRPGHQGCGAFQFRLRSSPDVDGASPDLDVIRYCEWDRRE